MSYTYRIESDYYFVLDDVKSIKYYKDLSSIDAKFKITKLYASFNEY